MLLWHSLLFKRRRSSPHNVESAGRLTCAFYNLQLFHKNDSLVKMTLPEDNKTILAAEYKLRLPSGEQLLAEVKRAEEEFEAAHDEMDAMARISGGEK